jgi:UDP-N-acetylmuramate dehydrogenase
MIEQMKILRETLGDRLMENIPLARYTTARVGGSASCLVALDTITDLVQLVQLAQKTGIPYKLLGEGSNILVSDTGFDGLIIVNHTHEIDFDLTHTTPQVRADSGVNLVTLSRKIAEHGLSGFEWACGIPGTVGGAVYGNAGANGSDIQSNLVTADIMFPDGVTETWPCEKFQYTYRTSVLKRNNITAIVLNATFWMEKQDSALIKSKMAEFTAKRKESQPSGASLGSIFKNPAGDFAGRLIEAAGLKGTRIGGAEISTKHANFILSGSKASAMDIFHLIKHVQVEIHKKFGILLETEIEFLGKFDSE